MNKRFTLGLVLFLLAGCGLQHKTSSSALLTPSSEGNSSSLTASSSAETPSSVAEPTPSPSPVSSSSAAQPSSTLPSSTPTQTSSATPTSSSRPTSSSSSSYGGGDGYDVNSYYSSVSGSGRSLFNSLHTRLNKGFTTLGYDGLLDVYPYTDVNEDGTIHDYYSKTTHYHMGDANKNYSAEGDSFNREHSIPKSWWGGSKANQGCDVYIVVPTDGYVNNRRSNFPFGLTNGETYKSHGDYCKLGPSLISSYNSTDVFEPGDDKKGDFARIHFYALTKWDNAWNWTQGNGGSTFSGSLNTNMGLTDYALNLFLQWHSQDPVDDYERNKNDVAVQYQHNRNPYVDHPEWVNSIWGGTYVELNPTSINLRTSSDFLYVGSSMTINVDVAPTGANGKVSFTSLNPDIASVDQNGLVTGLSTGIATIQAVSQVDSSVTATIEIDVRERSTVEMEFITCKAVTVYEGKSEQLEIETYPIYAYPRPTYSFVSEDQSIATVDGDGLVTGVSEGSTKIHITATQGQNVYEKEVSVTVLTASGTIFRKATGTITDGNYLIVYEAGEKVLNANEVKDNKNKNAQTNVAINNGVIEGDYGALCFTITHVSQGYAIRTPGGKYVNASGKGSFDLSDDNAYCDIVMTSDGAKIVKNNYTLRYNTDASYFRFYESSSSVGGIATLYRAE